MSRNGSIELSPKYGVNPVIPLCFWCGEEKNEIALMGRVRKRDTCTTAYGTKRTRVVDNDVEMPRSAVIDYEPCECCKEKFSQGVRLIECSEVLDDRPPISTDDKGNDVYPTGRTLVMKPEAMKRIFNIDLEAGKAACCPKEVFEKLISNI